MINRRNHGTGHSYYADGIDGFSGPVKMPGVTTVVRMMPKDALIGWAGNTTADYALDNWDELARLKPSTRLKRMRGARQEELDAAANRGTLVHRLAERLVTGDEVEVPEHLVGHVESYVRFLDRFQPEPIGVELVVVNRTHRYCGTADLVAVMQHQTWLLELATNRSGIFPERALQACGYLNAEHYTVAGDPGGTEHPMSELAIDRCGAVHVRGDGYDVRPLETGPEVWDYFLRLRANLADEDRKDTWVGEAIEPLRLVG